MVDHVHMMIAIPPKYAMSQGIGHIKGKSAIIWRSPGGSAQASAQHGIYDWQPESINLRLGATWS